jgi:integrase
MAKVTERKNKDGKSSYLIRVSNGYNINGKQLVKNMTWTPEEKMTPKQIEKELARQVVLFEEKVKLGYSIDENVKFADYSARWLAAKKQDLAPLTYKRYEHLLVKINEAIGHIKLGKITPLHLKEFYKNLTEVISPTTKKHYTPITIKHYHRCIAVILATATKEQIIPRNVASRSYMDAPKVPKKEPAHLNLEEAQKFVSLANQHEDIRVKTALLLLIYSGVRIGELCGLEWKDIDYDNNTIKIVRASQYCRGYGTITKEPKNETSKRTIKLPEDIMKTLKEYNLWYKQQRLMNGDRWIDTDRLFIQANGKAILAATINAWLDKLIKENDLPRVTPHSLRHTFCTLLIANGVDIRTVSAKAGHSRTSTTLDIYTHAVKEADELATQVLDDILTPKKAN